MVEEPLISIILPVYNGRRYLREAIVSCLSQSYTNFELIIVDDGSTDDSVLIAEEYKLSDNRIKILSNGENLTLPVSLNIGHKEAQGDLITWTSDDNIFQKDALKKLHQTMINEGADIVYSDYLIIDDEGVLVGQGRLNDIEYLLLYGVIGACFLYKKEVYARNEGFNENLFLVEDYDFWLRALKHSSYFKLDNPGYYYYRFHPNSLTIRMKSNKELKVQCLNNLRSLYSNLFSNRKLKDKDFLIDIIIKRFLEGPYGGIDFLLSKTFFSDLKSVSAGFLGFSEKKIKRIFLNDAIETILKNRRFQNISVLIALHRHGRAELMRLPINRYLAIVKKCLLK